MSGSGDHEEDSVLRIVVVDDQASVREGLALMLNLLPHIEVVASAANGQEALLRVAEHRPDAILLDLYMPVMDGIETTRRLTADHPDVAIVVLTTYADDASVLNALRAGARSFLTKDADRLHIARTLRTAVTGYGVLDPKAQAALLAAASPSASAPTAAQGTTPFATGTVPRPTPLPDGLTNREAEILTLISRGLSNHEITEALFLSGNTVKTHINRVFAKTRSRDRVAATQYARRHGLG